MLELTRLRTLEIRESSAPGRPAHLSAASGLVRLGPRFYVVADDEYHLGIFPVAQGEPGELLRLFPGTLPHGPHARKKHKPDLEALVRLPAFSGYPHGALFALGSGSKANRQTGVLLGLNAQLKVEGVARLIDLAPLYDGLATEFDDLNIEGAAIVDDALILLQRGNLGGSVNSWIEFDLRAVLAALVRGDALDEARPRQIRRYDLGERHGVPLGFTDAASLPGGEVIFTAVAENTEDSYRDGACVGAAIGLIDATGILVTLEPLALAHKLEGIVAWPALDGVHFLVVTDADDANVPAQLLSGGLAR